MEEYKAEDLIEMVTESANWNGSLDEYRVEENDEDFFDMVYGDNVMEAVRAVCYGEYKYTDEYVQLNALGNLVSFSEWEYEKFLYDNADEIVSVAKELHDSGELDLSELFD